MGADFYLSQQGLCSARLARANALLDDTFDFLKEIKWLIDYDHPEIAKLIQRYEDHVDNMRKF